MRLLLLLFTAACAGNAPTVLAAASLGGVLPEILAGEDVRASFGPSSALARQIEHGLRADVYVSADLEWVDHLLARGHGVEKREVARNALVAWVRAGARAPAAPPDLSRFGRIAVGADVVPVGRYAREALKGLDLDLLSLGSAPAVIAAVRSGAADVGIAYATDGVGGVVEAFRFDRPRPSYWALLCRDRPAARRLLDELTGARAAAAFARHGFLPVR